MDLHLKALDTLYLNHFGKISFTHGQLTPSAVQARDAIVTLDGLPALGAFPMAVPLDPMVRHRLRRLLALHVGGYARGWRPLNASFVDRVLANCGEKESLAR